MSSTKLGLRLQTRIADLAPRFLDASPPRKIVFIHVPKCAGTTIQSYIAGCVGGKRSGKTVKLTEMNPGALPSEDQFTKARKARFVCGHFSWNSFEKLDVGKDAFTFTFLREPRSRLESWYRYSTAYPKIHNGKIVRSKPDIFCGLSRLEMYTSDDPSITALTDNLIVRQLSGRLDNYPVSRDEWPGLLKSAMRNLQTFSFVGFQNTFAVDFNTVSRMLKFPSPSYVPRNNETVYDVTQEEDDISASHTVVERLVHWDNILYNFAHTLRRLPMS